MSEFQITFRGVLPEPNLRRLAEAMYHKVKGAYGRTSGFHLAIIEQPPAPGVLLAGGTARFDRPQAISARVQLHGGPHGVQAAAEASNENPVAAVREAFAQAYSKLNDAAPSSGPSLAKANVGKLLLFRRPA